MHLQHTGQLSSAPNDPRIWLQHTADLDQASCLSRTKAHLPSFLSLSCWLRKPDKLRQIQLRSLAHSPILSSGPQANLPTFHHDGHRGESTAHTQQWLLSFFKSEDALAGEPLTALPDVNECDIVAIKNFGSGRVLEHYHGERIEAFQSESEVTSGGLRVARKTVSPKWYRIRSPTASSRTRTSPQARCSSSMEASLCRHSPLTRTLPGTSGRKELEVTEESCRYY